MRGQDSDDVLKLMAARPTRRIFVGIVDPIDPAIEPPETVAIALLADIL